MANPIVHCLERLNLEDDTKVKQRAEQFQGQLSGLPAKLFDKGPNCKVVVCIQLAYESLGNYDWDLKLGSQLAGCTASAYESALSIARQRLNIHPTVNFEALTVALGSSTMLNPVKELWANFEEAYQNQFIGAAKQNAQKELEMPCWKGAAIFCCAKAFGEHLAKDKLHTLCACTKADLNKCIKLVETTCAEYITKLKSKSTKSVRSRRTQKQNGEEEDEEGGKKKEGNAEPMDVDVETKKSDKGQISNNTKKRRRGAATSVSNAAVAAPKLAARPVSGIVSMINHQDYTKTKRFAEFKQWKSAMIDQLQQVN